MEYVSADDYSEKQIRAAQRVLDSLDHLDKRMASVYTKLRNHGRRHFRKLVYVVVPDPIYPCPTQDSPNFMKVWARSISQSGLSFICPLRIPVTMVMVGLPVQDGEISWFNAELVRCREFAGDGFWEYGVSFRARATV